MEDAFIGLWFDIDLGDSNDDLVFCDTTLSLGAFWNDGEDADPWPHTGYSSFPDMFQSLGAGELLRVHIILYLCNSLFRMDSSHMSSDVSTISYRTCIKSDARTFSRTSVRASIRH